jgi:hypothetical protein
MDSLIRIDSYVNDALKLSDDVRELLDTRVLTYPEDVRVKEIIDHHSNSSVISVSMVKGLAWEYLNNPESHVREHVDTMLSPEIRDMISGYEPAKVRVDADDVSETVTIMYGSKLIKIEPEPWNPYDISYNLTTAPVSLNERSLSVDYSLSRVFATLFFLLVSFIFIAIDTPILAFIIMSGFVTPWWVGPTLRRWIQNMVIKHKRNIKNIDGPRNIIHMNYHGQHFFGAQANNRKTRIRRLLNKEWFATRFDIPQDILRNINIHNYHDRFVTLYDSDGNPNGTRGTDLSEYLHELMNELSAPEDYTSVSEITDRVRWMLSHDYDQIHSTIKHIRWNENEEIKTDHANMEAAIIDMNRLLMKASSELPESSPQLTSLRSICTNLTNRINAQRTIESHDGQRTIMVPDDIRNDIDQISSGTMMISGTTSTSYPKPWIR